MKEKDNFGSLSSKDFSVGDIVEWSTWNEEELNWNYNYGIITEIKNEIHSNRLVSISTVSPLSGDKIEIQHFFNEFKINQNLEIVMPNKDEHVKDLFGNYLKYIWYSDGHKGDRTVIDILKPLIKQFMPFAQSKMGFNRAKTISQNDATEANNPMGKTGFYDPQDESITIFIGKRHPKDIMRSLAHELMHHTQKCNGEFDNVQTMGEEGYAQNDMHLRKMEASSI